MADAPSLQGFLESLDRSRAQPPAACGCERRVARIEAAYARLRPVLVFDRAERRAGRVDLRAWHHHQIRGERAVAVLPKLRDAIEGDEVRVQCAPGASVRVVAGADADPIFDALRGVLSLRRGTVTLMATRYGWEVVSGERGDAGWFDCGCCWWWPCGAAPTRQTVLDELASAAARGE